MARGNCAVGAFWGSVFKLRHYPFWVALDKSPCSRFFRTVTKPIRAKGNPQEQGESPVIGSSVKTHDLDELQKKLQKGRGAKTVLLVEDDKDFSAMIQIFLAEHGYTVVQARNGAQGVKRILEQDFDIILCDMVMPNFPGDMFYRAVQLTKAYLCERFIFMTGHRGEEHITNFIREVKGLMLWKPFQFHVLMEAIKTIEIKRKRTAQPPRV